eukprot:6194725-Pleurochrysis_carterae.AAC.2
MAGQGGREREDGGERGEGGEGGEDGRGVRKSRAQRWERRGWRRRGVGARAAERGVHLVCDADRRDEAKDSEGEHQRVLWREVLVQAQPQLPRAAASPPPLPAREHIALAPAASCHSAARSWGTGAETLSSPRRFSGRVQLGEGCQAATVEMRRYARLHAPSRSTMWSATADGRRG